MYVHNGKCFIILSSRGPTAFSAARAYEWNPGQSHPFSNKDHYLFEEGLFSKLATKSRYIIHNLWNPRLPNSLIYNYCSSRHLSILFLNLIRHILGDSILVFHNVTEVLPTAFWKLDILRSIRMGSVKFRRDKKRQLSIWLIEGRRLSGWRHLQRMEESSRIKKFEKQELRK